MFNQFVYLVLSFQFIDGTQFDVITMGINDLSRFLRIGYRVASRHYIFRHSLIHVSIGWSDFVPDGAKWHDSAFCWLYCNPDKWDAAGFQWATQSPDKWDANLQLPF